MANANTLLNFIDLCFGVRMKDPRDKLIIIAHWAIVNMGYSPLDENDQIVDVFMFDQDRTHSSEIRYSKNGSIIATDHLLSVKFYYLTFTVDEQNTTLKTEIAKYLNDDGSLINEQYLTMEVQAKLRNILRNRRETRKRKLKRQQDEEKQKLKQQQDEEKRKLKRQKTTTASAIDRTDSDDDDEPLDLTTK